MSATLPRIVVVDDDSEICTFMLDLLSMRGYQVFIWDRARDAHAYIAQAMPALVIVNLSMEHPTAGLDVLRTLHADPTTAAIPAILYSAALHTLDGQRADLHAAGVRLLAKPFQPHKLITLIASRLDDAASAT
jgi:CheY-like chemotaxis protein